MNRYQTLAIFVTLMIIVLCSANSYFLKKAKTRLAQQTTALEQRQQQINLKEVSFEEEEEEEEEDGLEEENMEDDNDFEDSQQEEPKLSIETESLPQHNPEIPQTPVAKHPVIKEESNEGNKLNQNINSRNVSIPCVEPYRTEKLCSDRNKLISEQHDSVSKIFLGASNGETDLKTHMEADITGSNMTIALAEKICSDKKMRLPEVFEFYQMFTAQKTKYGDEFVEDFYWAKPFNENSVVYCYANTKNCRRYEGISDPPKLYRVRCVK